jgi:hypothetical protein
MGELLMQPDPERVAGLRALVTRQSPPGDDFNAASLAGKAVRDADTARFLANDVSPELMNALVTAKAPGKTELEKLALGLSIHDKSSLEALRMANKRTGADLEKFAQQYLETADRANNDLRTPQLRAMYAEYRMDMLARAGQSPTGLKLGAEAKVGQGPTDWKLGQPMGVQSSYIGESFKASGTTTAHAGYRMTDLLDKLPGLIRANNAKGTAEVLKEAYKDLVMLNGDAAVAGKAANNPQLAEQLRMFESQLSRMVKLPEAQQLPAVKDALKTEAAANLR